DVVARVLLLPHVDPCDGAKYDVCGLATLFEAAFGECLAGEAECHEQSGGADPTTLHSYLRGGIEAEQPKSAPAAPLSGNPLRQTSITAAVGCCAWFGQDAPGASFPALLRAAEQRLIRVLHRHGHERVEQLRRGLAAAHGPNIAEVAAGVGFQCPDLLLVG